LEDVIITLFLGEIRRNCEFALTAYEDILKYSQSIKPGDYKTLNRLWLSLELFLIAFANVSKILWPSKCNRCSKCKFLPELPQDMLARRQKLKTILSIEESSPLAFRTFRNYFEHYDSELERWVKKSESKIIVDSNIGPIESIDLNPNNPRAYMRNFDQYKCILHFRGKEFDIKQAALIVRDLLNKTLIL
jgi:hypothetical protein